jgi:hypothetical protein
VSVSGECRFADGRQLMISPRYSPKRSKDGGTQWDVTWEVKWQMAVSRELQVPRSFPRVGDAARWIATGPWRVYGE